MAAVLRLAEFSNQETIRILRALLTKALRGEVIGVAVCFKARPGVEHCVYSGPYKANPAEAVNAAARMSLEMTQLQLDAAEPL